jgi:ABC-type Fe3+-hydroxamate transport system substrate-binding protein
MIEMTDHIGHSIHLPQIPNRIVSLVPSQTELLHALGLEEEVVGITKFCIHPTHWFKQKQRIGGTKNINFDRIAALQPDLIIANKEENIREQVNALRSLAPVFTTDVHDLNSACSMIEQIGILTNTANKATALIKTIQEGFSNCQTSIAPPEYSCIYLIWKDPYMTIGGDTLIHDILQRAGLNNLFANRTRYPETSLQEMAALQPPIVLLSSEPYPFKEKHLQELASHLPNSQIHLVDGEMFSWYGSKLQETPAYLLALRQILAG